jgi:hypothetical protein
MKPLFGALRCPVADDSCQKPAPAVVGNGKKGSPIFRGKSSSLVSSLFARPTLLIPSIGGELGSYLLCVHFYLVL